MRVAVLGAGVSGLAAANRLAELGGDSVEVRVFDRSSRPGGVVRTERRAGFLLEEGPDCFLSEKPAAVALCRRLGLESELLPTRAENRRSMILRGGRLHPVPDGFYLTAPVRPWPFLKSGLFSPAGKLRALAEPFVRPRRDDADESVGDFIRRRFGAEALERAGQPLLAGIHTGDPDYLGIEGVFPRFREYERRYGSVTRGLRASGGQAAKAAGPRYTLFLSFRNGMETLTRALAERLPEGALRLSEEASPLFREGGAWIVRTARGAESFDRVLVALSASGAASALSAAAPGLAADFASVRHESVATVSLAYPSAAIARPLAGFGFVVPRGENSPLVACSFVSRKFEGRAPEGTELLRAFVGGAFGAARLEVSDDALVRSAREALAPVLGLAGEPLFSHVARYPRAMPQYGVGHRILAARLRSAEAVLPGLFLAGNYLHGVGIPDCIAGAEESAERLLRAV